MQGQWADAVDIYQRALAANPAQANLWERIADIRATQLKDPAGAAEALREATQYAPMDARLHYKLSQAYAVIQKGPRALAAIAHAVELDPGNPTYLRARGEIACGPAISPWRSTASNASLPRRPRMPMPCSVSPGPTRAAARRTPPCRAIAPT